jgi:hypothetical protein
MTLPLTPWLITLPLWHITMPSWVGGARFITLRLLVVIRRNFVAPGNRFTQIADILGGGRQNAKN